MPHTTIRRRKRYRVITEAIIEARLARGWSQMEFSEHLGFADNAAWRLEHNKKVGPKLIQKAAEVLGLSIKEFVTIEAL